MSSRTIFEDLRRRRWDTFAEWLANDEPETLHLEFKKKCDPRTHRLDEVDWGRIAKAISGFANVDGGVLVLGADTHRGRDDGPDTLRGYVSIADVAKAAALVDKRAHEVVAPAISGLEIVTLEEPDAAGAGLIAIHAPASNGGPHRTMGPHAEAKVAERYFHRTATNTLVMTHTHLADRFGRRPAPSLRARFVYKEISGQQFFEVRVVNRGRGVARLAAISFDAPTSRLPWALGVGGGSFGDGWTVVRATGGADAKGVTYIANDGNPVFPKQEVRVMQAQRVVDLGMIRGAVRLSGQLCALDAQPRDFEVEWDVDGDHDVSSSDDVDE